MFLQFTIYNCHTLSGKTLEHDTAIGTNVFYNFNFTTTAFQHNYVINNQLTKISSFTSSLQSLISPVFSSITPIFASQKRTLTPKRMPALLKKSTTALSKRSP